MSVMMMMMWPCSRSWIRRRRYVQSTIYEAIVYDRWTVNAITTRPVLSAERQSFSAAIFIFFCLCFIYLRPDDTRMPWLCDEKAQVIAPAAARRYVPRRWQFVSWRIYVRPRTGPLSAHLWWPANCRQPAC